MPVAAARRIFPIRWRIILPFALLTTSASALFGWIAARQVADQVERDIRNNLGQVVARLATAGVPLEGQVLQFMATLADARLITLDARGGILASSLPPGEAEAWRGPLAGHAPPGALEYAELTAGGEAFLVAFSPIPWRGGIPAPSGVMAAVPMARVTQTQRAATVPVLWLVGLQGLAAIVIGAWVASSLTRPLGRLADQARRIAAGDLGAPSGVRTSDEIGLLASTLDRMVASLRDAQAQVVQAERMATLGRVAAGLAHEIRNPLSSVRMHVQILARSPQVPAETAQLLLSEIDRLDGILSELLTWARPETFSPGPTDLAALAEEALTLMGPQLAHRGIRIVREIGPVPVIQADRDRLRQVLRNLLANARDALGTGGTLTLRLRQEGDAVALEVADDGPGVPPGIRDRVFEPFVTGRKEGTGLGLTISKGTVEAHGGTIALVPTNAGSCFRVRLPARKE